MKRTVLAFESKYVIDGVQMESTPSQMLADCMEGPLQTGESLPAEQIPVILDESSDPVPGVAKYNAAQVETYIKDVAGGMQLLSEGSCPYPGSYTKRKIAQALISCLWRKGHFGLNDLTVSLKWNWDSSPLGNMAAFYRSVQAASEYLFSLAVRLENYEFSDTDKCIDLQVTVSADGKKENLQEENEYDFLENSLPKESMSYCWISDEMKCPDVLDVKDASDWVIYVPFDSCDFRLGDSVLEKLAGSCGDRAPEIQDPDYFMDCFEILRELTEDGVVVAGRTVGEGGLARAAAQICGKSGLTIDVSAIESAYCEKDFLRILFAETPGVLIQIRDDDYDYVDSQMILQDIAYYPIGHPRPQTHGLKLVHGKKPGISDILASLIQDQATEGED